MPLMPWAFIATLTLLVTGCAGPSSGPNRGTDALSCFDEITEIVTADFYDPTFRGLRWSDLVAGARATLRPDSSDREIQAAVNPILDRLNASHTRLYTPEDPTYWALHGVFSGKVDGVPLAQIGAWFEAFEGRWFARNVFLGSPAAKAGLREGDEIVSIDGRPLRPVASFKEAEWVTLTIRRQPSGPVQELVIPTIRESLQRTHLRALRRGTRIITAGDKRLGYIHVWSGTHDAFLNAMTEQVSRWQGRIDALILDLRDGFGGAHPGYAAPFLPGSADGKPVPAEFDKPLVILINDGTRSGKEWVAQILKAAGRAKFVGTTTKGAVLAGRYGPLLDDRFLLYLAVADPGFGLEGVGVSPDVRVPMPLPYRAGEDRQLATAVSTALAMTK